MDSLFKQIVILIGLTVLIILVLIGYVIARKVM